MSAGVIGLVASPAIADGHTGQPGPEGEKISVCHRTNAETNPYVNEAGITISKNGVIWAGHNVHTGPVFQVGMKADHDMWGDIIPPFSYTDKDGQHSYPGMNWTSTGQAIYRNGCVVPGGGTNPGTLTPLGIVVSDLCDPGNLSWSENDPNFRYEVQGQNIVAIVDVALNGKTVTGTQSWPVPVETNVAACPSGGGGGGSLLDLSPAVTFTDPDCDNLEGAAWDGNLDAVLDYAVTGDVEAGETVTVEAKIEPAQTGKYKFAPGATTKFTHTFDDITLADCVAGEETVIPKPDKPDKPDQPEPKPDKEPTVKGVQVVAPPAAAPAAAAPTAVAAGLGGTTASPIQTIAQMLVAGGMLLLMAGAWIGLGRREFGTHEA